MKKTGINSGVALILLLAIQTNTFSQSIIKQGDNGQMQIMKFTT